MSTRDARGHFIAGGAEEQLPAEEQPEPRGTPTSRPVIAAAAEAVAQEAAAQHPAAVQAIAGRPPRPRPEPDQPTPANQRRPPPGMAAPEPMRITDLDVRLPGRIPAIAPPLNMHMTTLLIPTGGRMRGPVVAPPYPEATPTPS